jgi:hypothetical protein
LDNPTTSLDDKGKPWLDIAEDTGVTLPQTTHFRPSGLRTVNGEAIQRACKRDEDIINAVCEEEKELDQKQADGRYYCCEDQLKIRPHSKHWKDVYFCDEFHLGIGPQVTKKIKRKRGSEHRYKPQNVHRKKLTAKDTKAKAREDGHLKLINVFVIIGWNYRKVIPYKIPGNDNGKMTGKVYTEEILPQILDDLQGITLF